MTDAMRILVVDDDEVDALITKRLLRNSFGSECSVEWVNDWESGSRAIENNTYTVCLVDHRLGSDDGLELVRHAVDRGCTAPIILFTGMTSSDVAIESMKAGAADYLDKSELSEPLLSKSIRYALARKEHHKYEIDAKELLKKKNQELSDLYETAHQFVDNVSHEFRTPLTVIREFSSILADGLAGDLNEEQQKYLGIVLNRTDDLGLMIDDMLDISKIEAGLLGVFRRKVTVGDIIERVRITLERKSLNFEVGLEFDIQDETCCVFCDPENIARVIINLGVNAIKFSGKNGHVKIWAMLNIAGSQIEIGVTDNGPGISTEDMQVIFDRFKQVGKITKSSTKGFGLGLNIAQELVRLNLGSMSVKSDLGSGSTFSFDIPVFNLGIIVKKYVEHIERVADGSSGQVALFTTIVSKDIDPQESEKIELFLQQQLRLSDLLVKKDASTWLLCTHQNRLELEVTVKRYQNALIAANDDVLNDDLPDISYHAQGLWDLSDQSDDFVRAFVLV